MSSYYRVMLGRGSGYAAECFTGDFIGADYGLLQDLTHRLPEDWRSFNQEFIPVLIAAEPGKSKIAAGLACGSLWMVARGIAKGDHVLCPDGAGTYHVGEVSGDYYYQPEGVLPHRRSVHWLSHTISRPEMSEALRRSTGSAGTVANITNYRNEIEGLLGGAQVVSVADETVEDLAAFAMEKHLEDFLVQNWAQTELGKEYDIYEEEGGWASSMRPIPAHSTFYRSSENLLD